MSHDQLHRLISVSQLGLTWFGVNHSAEMGWLRLACLFISVACIELQARLSQTVNNTSSVSWYAFYKIGLRFLGLRLCVLVWATLLLGRSTRALSVYMAKQEWMESKAPATRFFPS